MRIIINKRELLDNNMTSKVYFKDAEVRRHEDNQVEQVKRMFSHISPVKKDDIVAIKIHPGEYGNTTHIRPIIIRTIVDLVRDAGGIPFVTETTTLYKGMKLNAANLLIMASMNGFNQASMNAPILVADGLRGNDGVCVKINGKVLDSITVASGISEADSMIVISHGKGHPISGFGGAIKHLGMGCLDKNGKTIVHKVGKISIDPEKCISCGICVDSCAWGAITPPEIDYSICRGELSCVGLCPEGAIIPPDNVCENMQVRLGEAAFAPIKLLEGRIGYINWVYDITPGCDCFNFSSPAFADDVGILGSRDPVAIDAATIDLINEKMTGRTIQDIWDVDPLIHINSAENIGCGSNKYKLIDL